MLPEDLLPSPPGRMPGQPVAWMALLSAVFDDLPQGAILADPDARLLQASRAAWQVLEAMEGLRLDARGILRATVAADTAQLHRQIARCAAPGPERLRSALMLRRRESQRPLQVLISPVSQGAGALLLVADPDRLPDLAAGPLREFYGLTAAEAAVAQLVVRGEGLRQVAASLGLTVATVKTHLQHVFDKTHTRRQAELVRLLLGGGLLVRPADGRAAATAAQAPPLQGA